MEFDKSDIIKYRIEKSQTALHEADYCLKQNSLHLAENRIYYSIFYLVSALAEKDDFATSKHGQLLGWFNKNYVNAGIVDKKFGKIYVDAFEKDKKVIMTIL
ncbi:MAG: hypothetical protein JSS63_12690 [Bacteroidetes bacterium]|nr:hypothetical protein [Bacteroidota bacterium]MBX7046027.1 hypothetical protein [Ignavibacteria bacterium]